MSPVGGLPREAEVQAGLVRLFRACGGVVYSTSQGYRKERGGTRMTPGLPDLVVFFPRGTGRLLFFEVKRPGGKRSPAQEQFGKLCSELAATGGDDWDVFYGWGGLEQATALLRLWGMLK